MRHAQAASTSPDLDRRLSEQGVNQAIRAAKQLLDKGLVLDKVIHSTAERTRATAEYLLQVNRFDPSIMQARPDFYQSTVGGLLQSINLFDNSWNTVGIIGHNPTLSYLVEYLASNADNTYLDTSHFVLLSFDLDTWVGVDQYTGTLEWQYRQ